MSKNPKPADPRNVPAPAPTPPPAPANVPAREEDDDLKPVKAVGMTELKRGYVAYLLTIVGDRVVDRQLLGEDKILPRVHVENNLRRAVAENFIMPRKL